MSGNYACVDATAHFYQLYVYAAQWQEIVGGSSPGYSIKVDVLRAFMQNELFDRASGWFYDIWAIQKARLNYFRDNLI
jgi:hypothetical protein